MAVGNATSTTSPSEETSLHAMIQAFTMIIFSEIGDKTFLIAAILAMRHPRMIVFAGAFGSLVVMSILSAELGHLLPTLLPKRWTQALAAVLFLVFGVKMLQEGREMAAGNQKIQEEMKEAEEEIEGDEAGHDEIPLEEIEEGGMRSAGASSAERARSRSQPLTPAKTFMEGARNFCSLLLGPVFVQSFVLTFLGEWGDRSQISTIALGAAHNVYVVSLGTIIGHSCCTALAVIGGRYVSTKISVKHVTLAGSALFLLFGLIYLYEAFISMDIDVTDFSYGP
ncbi:GDT1 family protein [Abortiporus biennis]